MTAQNREWDCSCGYSNIGPICTHCGQPADVQDRQEPSKRRWLDLARQAIAQRPHPPCANCLRPAAISCPIGNDIGTQRDPARESIWLCPDCIEALIDDLALFHERYATERTVRRDGS